MTMCSQILVGGFVAFAAATGPVFGDSYQYLVRDLGTLSGPVSGGFDLNEVGSVAGLSMLSDSNFHAAYWDPSPVDLGTLGVDTQSVAYAVNNTGQVVGVSYNYGDIHPHAFSWQGGILTALGDFSPRGINDHGDIVGCRMVYSAADLWVEQACRWSGGVLTDFDLLGGRTSTATAVNELGWAVGQAHLPNNLTLRACLWVDTTVHDLGSLHGGVTAQSAATDINDLGQIAGWSEVAGGESHACVFSVDGGGQVTNRTDLGVLGGGYSYAYGINNSGAVVGTSDARGFIWQGGSILDLNVMIPPASGWSIARAVAINDAGEVVAEGSRCGFAHALLLTPVTCIKGDLNDDGVVDGLDVQGFLGVLLGTGVPQTICAGDVHSPQDGWVSSDDVGDFVNCLLIGNCD